jgi:hypothetical protein
VFPLFVCLFDLHDVGEEAAVEFGQGDLVADDCVDPVLVVLEGQVQDEAAALSQVFFELVVDQVQNILFFDSFTQVEVFDNAFFDWSQAADDIAFFISFGWVFLKELDSFKDFIDGCFEADVDEVEFKGDGFGECGFAGFGATDDEELKGLFLGIGDDVLGEGVGIVLGERWVL